MKQISLKLNKLLLLKTSTITISMSGTVLKLDDEAVYLKVIKSMMMDEMGIYNITVCHLFMIYQTSIIKSDSVIGLPEKTKMLAYQR